MSEASVYPRRGLHGEVVHQIGLRILRGELKPGDPLPTEDELTGALAVSRTVLRESVKVLAAKGLVEARPKTGTRVRARAAWNLLDPDVLAWRFETSPDDSFFRNVVELRRIVEPEAARLAAERATDAEIAALDEAYRAMEAAINNLEAYIEPDLRFHELILEACHNDLLAYMVGTMRAVFRVLFTATRTPRLVRRTTPLHGAIVDAVAARDGTAAEEAMRTLIETSAAALARGTAKGSRRLSRG
jgi:GntR family galactonate operon transcriptional repressor